MDYKEIKELAGLMKEMELTVIDYSGGGESIRLERGTAPAMAVVQEQGISVSCDLPDSSQSACSFTVKSPMVGVFYSAPSAEKEAYVAVGDNVQAGDILCIIEAMKIMNEITAEQSGVITEICATDKQVVEFGQALFRIDTNVL